MSTGPPAESPGILSALALHAKMPQSAANSTIPSLIAVITERWCSSLSRNASSAFFDYSPYGRDGRSNVVGMEVLQPRLFSQAGITCLMSPSKLVMHIDSDQRQADRVCGQDTLLTWREGGSIPNPKCE